NEWHVIVSDSQFIEGLHKAPDDDISFFETSNDACALFASKIKYTLSPEIHHNPYHIPITLSMLTRNLATRFAGIYNEVMSSFDDVLIWLLILSIL
ncbi:hypothetical protein SERLA73DRAFT_17899, partial [Serpula lacrymans var. lacrymans S7.3]